MDISTKISEYNGERRYEIIGAQADVVVYPSPVRGLWCVGTRTEVFTEDLKLLPALSLGLNMAERGFESDQQKMNWIRQAHNA